MDNLHKSVDMRIWYSAMNEANAYIKSLPVRKQPNEKTIKQYEAAFRRMSETKQPPIVLAKTKNSFYHYRAAWCYVCEREAKNYLQAANKENDPHKKLKLIKSVLRYVDGIKKIPPDFSGTNLKASEKGGYISQWKLAKKPAQRSRSKKLQVARLPSDWQDRMFNHLRDINSKYLPVLSLLAVAGCRPAEVEKGVKVSRHGDSLLIEITTAKTHGAVYGQVVRSFTVKENSQSFYHLYNLVATGQQTIKIDSAKNLGEQIRKFNDRLFPNLSTKISAYTYRHNFAALIKASLTSIGVAVALGHSNDKSQSYYSRGKKSAGGFVIDNLNGTRKVKSITKNNLDYLLDESLSLSM